MSQLDILILAIEEKLNHDCLPAEGRWRLTHYENAKWFHLCSRASLEVPWNNLRMDRRRLIGSSHIPK